MRILYIDDTAYWRELYEDFFTQTGIEIKTLPDARGDFVKLTFDYQPDLILLDIMMPDVDGFQAIQIFKADERTKNIPIFFFSSMSDPKYIKKGLELGAEKYIVKGREEPGNILQIITDYVKGK